MVLTFYLMMFQQLVLHSQDVRQYLKMLELPMSLPWLSAGLDSTAQYNYHGLRLIWCKESAWRSLFLSGVTDGEEDC